MTDDKKPRDDMEYDAGRIRNVLDMIDEKKADQIEHHLLAIECYVTTLEKERDELKDRLDELHPRFSVPSKMYDLVVEQQAQLLSEIAELKRQLDSAMEGMNEYAVRLRNAEVALKETKRGV